MFGQSVSLRRIAEGLGAFAWRKALVEERAPESERSAQRSLVYAIPGAMLLAQAASARDGCEHSSQGIARAL